MTRHKIASSEEMQAAITQAAILGATVVVRAIKEADLSSEPHTREKKHPRRTLQNKTSQTNDESGNIQLEGT